MTISIGKRFETLKEISTIYEQSLSAINISKKFFGVNRIVRYSDVWFIDYVQNLRADESAVLLSKQMLKPLIDANNVSSLDLMQTFKLLIECNDDVSEVAYRLNVHRNTVIYRKNKIIDILGVQPFRNPMQFMYYAALTIM